MPYLSKILDFKRSKIGKWPWHKFKGIHNHIWRKKGKEEENQNEDEWKQEKEKRRRESEEQKKNGKK